MIRYDTPAIGPVSTAAVSAANVEGADRLGTMITLTQKVAGMEFADQVVHVERRQRRREAGRGQAA